MEIQKFSVSSEFWYCFIYTSLLFNSIKYVIFILNLYWYILLFNIKFYLKCKLYFYLVSAELTEMMGDLFIGHDMPEPPKESFFKGLFGGGSRSLDREELCK